jgi:hypothetical protein
MVIPPSSRSTAPAPTSALVFEPVTGKPGSVVDAELWGLLGEVLDGATLDGATLDGATLDGGAETGPTFLHRQLESSSFCEHLYTTCS